MDSSARGWWWRNEKKGEKGWKRQILSESLVAPNQVYKGLGEAYEFRITRIPKLYDPISNTQFFMPKRGDPKLYAISFGFNWSFLGDDPLRVFFLKENPCWGSVFGTRKIYTPKTHLTWGGRLEVWMSRAKPRFLGEGSRKVRAALPLWCAWGFVRGFLWHVVFFFWWIEGRWNFWYVKRLRNLDFF